MREICNTLEIDAAPERVWEVLAEFETWGAWNPLMPRIRGRLEPDAALSYTVRVLGVRLPVRARLLRVDPPRSLGFVGPRERILAAFFCGEHDFRLEPASGGRARLTHTERLKGWLVPGVWPVLGPLLQRLHLEMNEGLRERAEKPPGGAAPPR